MLALAGARRWSPVSAIFGLAAAAMIAWWAVRLPGEGVTALAALVVVALAGGSFAAIRLDGIAEGLARCLPAALAALAVLSIPFAAEGHVGVLGTGFNVDMSQHLFAANWLAEGSGFAPSLVRNGYPLGPHALAVAADQITEDLTTAFTAVTIAVPVVAAVSVLAALDSLTTTRATFVAVLTALAYLTSSYFAQGAFKELFEAVFLLGFALWLRDLTRAPDGVGHGPTMFVPGAVIAAGTLYVYSWPGLAWLAGTIIVWGAAEWLSRRRDPERPAVSRLLPPALLAIVLLVAMAAPEAERISKFGTSVDAVTERAPRPGVGAGADGGDGRGRDPAPGSDDSRDGPDYDNALGNLFGQVNPGSVFGIWPSGDFRVEPGGGSVPAFVFYLGVAVGAFALGLGGVVAWRQGEAALLAALAAAAAIWLAVRVGSTPYTSAKALQMLAPLVMLISARALVDPFAPVPGSDRRRVLGALAIAFLLAAPASSALALVNAPVGPNDYSPGVRKLANRFAGRSTLLLVPPDVIADQHGAEFYGWELRGAREVEVTALAPDTGRAPPPGVERVLVVGGDQEPPFAGLKRIGSSNRVVLWRVLERD